jgi:hypothetical protein
MNVFNTTVIEKEDQYQNKNILHNKQITPISINNKPAPKAINGKEIPQITNGALHSTDIPVGSTEDDELHPTLAMDSSGLLFGAYTLHLSILEGDIIYTVSQDSGDTWESVDIKDLWMVEGALDYPAVDYWGSENKFVGTFKPSPDDFDGSAEYLLRVDDPTDTETWSLGYWDWSGTYQLSDRESPDIAGYSDVGDATWFYGVMATVLDAGYEGSGYVPGEDVPCLCFPNYNEEGSEWNWWLSWDTDSYENCAHSCIDIDRSNGMMYAAWDYFNESAPENGRDIFLAYADVHDWWAEEWNLGFSLLGGSEENTYPDIAADNGYVYIVMQGDSANPGNQDIVCYYSHDGGNNWFTSVVAGDPVKDEMYPSIVADGEEARCIFTSDGDLYVSTSDDGGVTWDTPVKKVTGSVSMEYRTAKVATTGHMFWTDIRNGNKDIYYGSGEAAPIIIINSIAGGIGVSAVIENVGTGEATNVQWSLDLEGGLIIVGNHADDVISSIAPEASVTVKIPFVLGLGGVTIKAAADGATKSATGKVLLFLVTGVT